MFAKKKKVSVDFMESEYALLSSRAKAEGKSNSSIVNSLIGLFLRISPDVSKQVGNFCYEQYIQEKSILENLSGFKRDEAQNRAEQFEKLCSYFGYDTPSGTDTGMTIRFLKDGYVTYPKDWIVLEDIFGPADTCLYAGVVESRNSEKFGIPRFIFFCNEKYGKDYSDEMKFQIFEACAIAYPEFRKLYNLQFPVPDINDHASIKKWLSAPEFGLFHIVEKGDPLYWYEGNKDYMPPFGAMIIRNSHEQEAYKNENCGP